MPTDLPSLTGSLTFHGPLSEHRADGMVRRLAATAPSTVLDIGCGWGELTLRLLRAVPEARGTGIDLSADDLDRGRGLAEQRGLSQRMEFVEESGVATTRGPADLVVCTGAGQALIEGPYDSAAVLRELRRLVAPGGRVLLGEVFWQRLPTAEELPRLWPNTTVDDHVTLTGLVDLALRSGFRIEWIEIASSDEWDAFESEYLAATEVWLALNPGHPEAKRLRDEADSHRSAWLTYRNVLGLAYLTLVPVAA